ncbi:MAG: DUF2924 domain-containing protein [Planctomycetota bacterium]|nr:DUF2924 domain-containing protein [Planctomycetota bacterium]
MSGATCVGQANADVPTLAELPGLSLEQLRVLWPRVMGRKRLPPPEQRSLMLREIAWSIQERQSAGLDPPTQRLLAAAVRAAGLKKTMRTDVSGLRTRRRGPAELPPMTRLIREWSGVRHEVLVLECGNRFQYQDREYRSLSRIAREITGTPWSGPRFFGLTTRARPTPATKEGGGS